MIIGIDNDKLKFVADSNGKLVVTLENLTDAIVKKELLLNCVINAEPTVDAVPVIRCKDCLWHYGTICRRNNTMFWNDDGFCSYAERKNDETD